MNYVEKFFDGVQYVFSINAATFSGAIDVIVVKQPDGSFKSSPFHVRFGKLELLNPWEKTVTITVNGVEAPFQMKLGAAGEAFFVRELEEASDEDSGEEGDAPDSFLATSPPASPPLDMEKAMRETRAAAAAAKGPSVPGGLPAGIDSADLVPLTDVVAAASAASASAGADHETDLLPVTSYLDQEEAAQANGGTGTVNDGDGDDEGADDDGTDSASSKGSRWSFLWGWGTLPHVEEEEKKAKKKRKELKKKTKFRRSASGGSAVELSSRLSTSIPKSSGSAIVPRRQNHEHEHPSLASAPIGIRSGSLTRESEEYGALSGPESFSGSPPLVTVFAQNDDDGAPAELPRPVARQGQPQTANAQPSRPRNATIDPSDARVDDTGDGDELRRSTSSLHRSLSPVNETGADAEFPMDDLISGASPFDELDLSASGPTSTILSNETSTTMGVARSVPSSPQKMGAAAASGASSTSLSVPSSPSKLASKSGTLMPGGGAFELSLCGEQTGEFDSCKVSGEQFFADPSALLNDARLRVRLTSKNADKSSVWPWPIAAAALVSEFAFNVTLPRTTRQAMLRSHFEQQQEKEEEKQSEAEEEKAEKKSSRAVSRSWFSFWGSSKKHEEEEEEEEKKEEQTETPAEGKVSSRRGTVSKLSRRVSMSDINLPENGINSANLRHSRRLEGRAVFSDNDGDNDGDQDQLFEAMPSDAQLEAGLASPKAVPPGGARRPVRHRRQLSKGLREAALDSSSESDENFYFSPVRAGLAPAPAPVPAPSSSMALAGSLGDGMDEDVKQAMSQLEQRAQQKQEQQKKAAENAAKLDDDEGALADTETPLKKTDSRGSDLLVGMLGSSPSAGTADPDSGDSATPSPRRRSSTTHVKAIRLTSEQLQQLNLHEGRNSVAFSVTSSLQGTKTVHASIYLWNWRSKIVVSDIDGTITKSDVMGQVLPSLGRDWSHAGVAQLYTNIEKNNYKLLYLTSRPIGSANRTRGYINTLKQEGDVSLPAGPVLLSPERLLSAFHTELIVRRADVFKKACLADLRSLFPADYSPYYAGFGNRPTDVAAYRHIGIAPGKTFIINSQGVIKINNLVRSETYTSLNDLVEHMFPLANSKALTKDAFEPEEQFNSFQFWSRPL